MGVVGVVGVRELCCLYGEVCECLCFFFGVDYVYGYVVFVVVFVVVFDVFLLNLFVGVDFGCSVLNYVVFVVVVEVGFYYVGDGCLVCGVEFVVGFIVVFLGVVVLYEFDF